MAEAWQTMLTTAALAAVVSLGMALLIHGMSAVILRFSTVPPAAPAAPPAEEAGGNVTPSSRRDMEIAMAIAAAQAHAAAQAKGGCHRSSRPVPPR